MRNAKQATQADVQMHGAFEFSAVEVTFEAVSDEARRVFAVSFGDGAVSVKVPKSGIAEAVAACEARGLRVEGAPWA